MAEVFEMAAFPLGTVLLPGQEMTLRVFEPRYRVMLFDLREAHPAEFVVTMIERGSEVGGGDVRSDVGCIARILEQRDETDGTSILTVLGTDRAKVSRWLPEDPYPRAEATRPDDPAEGEPQAPERADAAGIDPEALRALVSAGARIRRMAEDLGQPPQPRHPDPNDDPESVVWQVALEVPLATIDRHQLLATDGLTRRGEVLRRQLSELEELLAAHLAMRPPGADD